MNVTYTFAWPPRELSPNARVHWAKLAKAKREYKEDCGWVIRRVARALALPCSFLLGAPRLPVQAQVTFVVTDSRRRDADNYMAMLKPMWDALVEMGVLVDDNKDVLTILDPRWERGETKQVVAELREAKP